MKPAAIWYVLPEIRVGGSEKHVVSLAAELRKRGHETGIACVFREGALAGEARREGVSVISLGAKPGRWGMDTLGRFFRWVRSRKIDLIHTYLFGFHFYAGLPARFAGVPAVLSSRREIATWRRQRHHWMENLGNLFVDRVTCCSRAAERWTLEKERIPAGKVLTIYNGINPAEFETGRKCVSTRRGLGIPDEVLLVGTVANFAPEKGYPYLLEAMQTLLRRDPKIWFLLVGSGPLEEEIREKARKIPGRERIIFTGTRLDVPDLMKAMDIFVLASVTEGFPNVLLEAMALARPVAATRVGGIPELVDSGEDGLLVPPKDGRALAEAVFDLSKDRERAAAFGERARQKILKNFTFDRMVDRYESLYLSLLQGKELKTPREKMLQPCAG